MADANPDPHGEWMHYLADDPYLVPATPPAGNPYAQVDVPVVILDEEDDPEEVDPGEDSEEYVPYGYDGEYDTDSDTAADEIPQDAQDPTEDLTDVEVTPPPPSPRPMRCCPEGNCPLTHRTARTVVPSVVQRDEPDSTPLFYREPQPYRHFEIGGPSQVPPPAMAPSSPPAVVPSWSPPAPTIPLPRDVPTMAQHRQVVSQVLQLQDMRTDDSSAMQTLYCRVGNDHSHANTMGAHIRGVEYRQDVTGQELRAAEREIIEMRGQIAELTRIVRRRLG